MRYLITPLSLIFLFVSSSTALAVDIPEDDIGSEEYNQMDCSDDNTQACIDNECLTSDDIDCQDNCAKISQEQCQQQINE
jgi:hypothetical protein